MNEEFFIRWMPYIIGVTIWSIPWKGVALWKAARKDDKIWFVVLLLVNTIGILEILYIYIFSKEKKEESNTTVEQHN
jgi:hypothetical protein